MATTATPARVSARIQQQKEAKLTTQHTGDKRQSSSNSDGNRNRLKEDISLAQNLIERCLQFYMPQKDVIHTLLTQAKIEPSFTRLVWQKLEEQNKEFFEAYYLKLRLKEQVVIFNHLLEQQHAMMSKLHASWMQAMPSLMAAGMPMQPDLASAAGTGSTATLPGGGHLAGHNSDPTSMPGHLTHPGGQSGFTLPLCPLDPASLLDIHDVPLIDDNNDGKHGTGSSQQTARPSHSASLPLLSHLKFPGVGTKQEEGMEVIGSSAEDLIDGLVVSGFGRGNGHEGDGLMLDHDHDHAGQPLEHLGGMPKAFSMSDLRGWHELEHLGSGPDDGVELKTVGSNGVGVQQPMHSGGHDSSSPDLMLDDAHTGHHPAETVDGMSLSAGLQDNGLDVHGGMDHGMGGLGVASDEVSAAFGNTPMDVGEHHMRRPYSLSELPGLDLGSF